MVKADWNLQPLFPDPILKQQPFADQHVGQASYVWRVVTAKEQVIVRTTRLAGTTLDAFWWGCKELFGVDPTDVFAMTAVNETLRKYAVVPIPAVVRQAQVEGAKMLVVEAMPGDAVLSFVDLSIAVSHELGRAIASIHQLQKLTFGNFQATLQQPLLAYPARMATVMQRLLERFHCPFPDIVAAGPDWVRAAAALPPPTHAVPILLDIDPTQFLADGHHLTALVDTEVYAYGPAAYDIVALEYLLDRPRAQAFAAGYETLLPLPRIADVRDVYRFLQRLMEVQGRVELSVWMSQPAWFD